MPGGLIPPIGRLPAHAYADGHNMSWQLVGFSKQTDHVASEFPISRDQIIQLRAVFDIGDDHWFASGCYPVTRTQWPAVIETLRCERPNPEQEYFVEGYAIDNAALTSENQPQPT